MWFRTISNALRPLTLIRISIVFFSMQMASLVVAQSDRQYAYSETFGVAEGLKHSVISDYITDRNDLLWISVNGTLQVFDGDQFIDMSHLVHASISSGSFGFEKGKNVFLLKQHILYKITPENYTSDQVARMEFPPYNPEDPRPKIIYEDAVYLYISHPNDSLYQVDKEALALKKSYLLAQMPNKAYRWSSIYVSPHPVSSIHYLDTTNAKCTFELASGKTVIDRGCPSLHRSALAAGDTIITMRNNDLILYTGGKEKLIPLPAPRVEFNGDQFLLSGRDQVYIALSDAIYLFDLRSLQWVSAIHRIAGLSNKELKVRQMLMDHTGHLYMATFNTGMIKIYPSNKGFQYISAPDKKYFIKCIRVSEKNNLVLAGTFQDGLLVFDTSGNLRHHIRMFPGLDRPSMVSSIIKISENRYILLSSKTYEITFSGDQYNLRELVDSTQNRLTYYDNPIEDERYDRYFIFNHRQIVEFQPDDQVPVTSFNLEPYSSCISAMISGDGYVMSRFNELIFYNQDLDTQKVQLNVPDFGYSRCLVAYPDHRFLVATDMGMFILDTAQAMKPSTRIYNQIVYSILPGKDEWEYWFSTDFGLYRLDKDLQYKRFAIESGLQENEFNTNSCYKTESGKLYFGGVSGITAFYPGDIEVDVDQPEAYISLFSVNGRVKERYIAPGHSQVYSLAPDETVIRLRLLGKGQRSPRNYNFQYKINELHDQWINLGRNMDIQFQLAPGKHTIYYHLGDSFDPQAPMRNALHLDIRLPIYKRWWFIGLMALGSISLLYFILDLRRRRLALRLKYEQDLHDKLHDDRVRISRELHDNIGAQMATVKRNINFLIEHNDQLSSQQVKHKMQNLENISSQINQELRDTIWAVQNENIDLAGFISRLKHFVFQVMGPDHPCRVYYEEHGNLHLALGPFIALNLHRICQETINNILKHAEATEIRIHFESKPDQLKVTITDNGIGYDASKVFEGYGLNNIRKRAELILAEVYFNRVNHSGSMLEVIMPIHSLLREKTKSDG